jgi:hypothetical protein
MNKKRLLKVRDRILAEKIPVIMEVFFAVKNKDAKKNWGSTDGLNTISSYSGIWASEMTKIPTKDGIAEHGCRTAGCIAGHAIMEVYGGRIVKKIKSGGISHEGRLYEASELAAGILGLNYSETARLFYLSNWPSEFRQRYLVAMSNRKYKAANKVVAKRIDHFIQTGE